MNDLKIPKKLVYKLLCFGFVRFYARRFNLSHKEEIELLKRGMT